MNRKTRPCLSLTLILVLLLTVIDLACGGGGGGVGGSTAPTGSTQPPAGPPQLTKIVINPPLASVSRGSSQSFTASGVYSDGSTKDLTSTVTWSVNNAYIAGGQIGSVRSGRPAPRDSGASSTAFNTSTQRDGFTQVTASSGTVTGAAGLAVVSPSRFAYVTNQLAEPSLTLYGVDNKSGDLRMRGYQTTTSSLDQISQNSIAPPFTHCVTIDPSNTFAYVSNPVSAGATPNFGVYSLDATAGAFTPIPNSPFAADTSVGCFEFEPSGKFAYALSLWSGPGSLVGYARDSTTGQLTELPWSPMTVGDSPSGLAIDPIGQYLYFVNLEINTGKPSNIAGYSINPNTGALTLIPGMPINVSNTVTSVAVVHPSANFAYISHGGGNTIDVYSIDRATGTLTLVPGATVTTDINPSALVFSVDGRFAYMSAAINSSGNVNGGGTIATYSVDSSTGKITLVKTTPAGTLPNSLTVDPSGQFLYCTDNWNYIRIFQIQSDGTPSYVRSVETRTSPTSIAILPGSEPAVYSPGSLFVTTSGDSLLTGYKVASDGSLTKGTSSGTPAQPNSLSLLPWGAQALVTATGAPTGSNLGAYLISGSSGTSSYEQFLGDAALAGTVVVSTSQTTAFQSDSSTGVVRTYGGGFSGTGMGWALLSFGVSNGSVISAFPTGAGAGPMAMVPSGSYLYVGNQAANSISAFAFWGELFEETSTGYSDGSPYSIGASPIALVADPMGLYLYAVCDDHTLRTYSIDAYAGGHLKLVATATVSAIPTSVAVDATGHFVYVGDASGSVSPFAVDPGSGTLTALTPIALPAMVNGLTLESSGQFAYVICGPQTGTTTNNGMIYPFHVNADGTLTALPAGPYAANNPTAIAYTDTVQ